MANKQVSGECAGGCGAKIDGMCIEAQAREAALKGEVESWKAKYIGARQSGYAEGKEGLDAAVKRAEEAEALAERVVEALEDTKRGDDKDDGLPCWCPSPTLAAYRRATGHPEDGGHKDYCAKLRAAVAEYRKAGK